MRRQQSSHSGRDCSRGPRCGVLSTVFVLLAHAIPFLCQVNSCRRYGYADNLCFGGFGDIGWARSFEQAMGGGG